MRNRLVIGLTLGALLVALASFESGSAFAGKDDPQIPFRLSEPKKLIAAEFHAMERAIPWTIRVPALPSDFRLMRPSWQGAISLDLRWCRKADGVCVHTWQSTSSSALLGDKDPTTPSAGTLQTIAGKQWIRNTGGLCVDAPCLSRRFDDEIAVSLNTNSDAAFLRRIAASFHPL